MDKKPRSAETIAKARAIGIKIKTSRIEKGFTQKSLAHTVGLTDAAVTQWESGATIPSVETLYLIAEVLGVTVDWLMREDGPNAPTTAQTTSEAEAIQLLRQIPVDLHESFIGAWKGMAAHLPKKPQPG